MPTPKPINSLFANDIHRRIEEVIKVDQTNEAIIKSEIDEYIVTDAIAEHYVEILERSELKCRYQAAPKTPPVLAAPKTPPVLALVARI